jgi:type IV secretion system protein VirD4
VRALYLRTPLADLAAAMTRYPYPPIQEAGRVLAQTDGKNERSGIFSTTARALWLYGDRLIQRATDRSDFTLRDLRERARPCSVYLSIPFGDQERLRPWTRLLLRQFCDYCVSRKEGWTWKMLGMIDEVPGLRRINIIPDGLNYFAGYGVRLALITPSMQELGGTYGQHHNFLEGCQGKVIFGMEDHAVAEVFSKRIGDTAVTKRRKVGRQWTTEQVTEPLLSPTALTNLAKDRQVVIVGRQKIIARKTYYKDNAVWAARSQL